MKGALLALVLWAVPAELLFQPLHREHGVTVEQATAADPWPWIRGTAELPRSPEAVAAVLTAVGRYADTFSDHISRSRVLGHEEDRLRVHLVWPLPFPFADRDGIVVYTRRTEGDRIVIRWRDDVRSGDPDTVGVRIERIEGETILAPLGSDRTLLTYVYYGDLGGSFWQSAREAAWRREPVAYVDGIRRALGIEIPE